VSPPGRPKGAQPLERREWEFPIGSPGRPKGAQRLERSEWESPIGPPGRPKGAQRLERSECESPIGPPGRPKGSRPLERSKGSPMNSEHETPPIPPSRGAAARRLVLASDNPGKRREFQDLLGGLGVDVVAQRTLGVEPAAEPYLTFLENALGKAHRAAARTGLPALADDSGLCCVALGGAPGVRSARFAGEHATDAENNAELLRRLAAERDRRGHYVCVLVAMAHADDPEPLIAEHAQWAIARLRARL